MPYTVPQSRLRIITPPSVDAVTMGSVKAQARIETDDEYALLQAYIKAAVLYVEQTTRRSLITQTWELVLDDLPEDNRICLPRGPIQDITSLAINGENIGFKVGFNSESLKPLTFSDTVDTGDDEPVVVRFVAGFGDSPTDIPADLAHAIRWLAIHFYMNREPLNEKPQSIIPLGLTTILEQHRLPEWCSVI